MPNNWLHAHNRISHRAGDFQSVLSRSPKSLPSSERLVPWERHPTTPILVTPRPLLHQGHETFDPWGRGFGSMALGIGQDRRGVRAPGDRYGFATLPQRSTDIHIQGRLMERNCVRQQARSIS